MGALSAQNYTSKPRKNREEVTIGPATPLSHTAKLDTVRVAIMECCSTLNLPFVDMRDVVNSSNRQLYTGLTMFTLMMSVMFSGAAGSNAGVAVYVIQIASEHIAPLQDAVDLEITTEEETSLLEAWNKYRVLLNRVDTSVALGMKLFVTHITVTAITISKVQNVY